MAAKAFKLDRLSHPTASGQRWELVDISVSDYVPQRFVPRRLIIGGAGNLTITDQFGGSTVTIPVVAGQTLDLAVGKVVKATTTATNILAVE